ncbi:helix-turn-helix domain-containing protein [Actinomadura hibisca]|uniref:helix-turn-helix domain-containing protein n=1 Tax=Actinomadura hibisca TaxID=68565 RepID=UPI000A9D0A5B|nr:helix-turn-helix transcriptional regulator [Actinomadura hibisca]
MPAMKPIDPFESLFAYFAYELRRHREARGMSQDQLAKELYTTRATIAAYESRRNHPKTKFALQLDEYFGTGLHFQALLYYMRREHLLEWFEKYMQLELEAKEIKAFQPLIVPGLLQTPEYASALLETGELEDVDKALQARMKRRDLLTRQSSAPPHLWVLLDQAVIQRPVGGAAVMREQLQHLIDVSHLRHVSIRVVATAAGAHIGMEGGFLTLAQPDGNVGFAEAMLAGRLIYEPAEVERLTLRYDRIGTKALHEEGSRRLIRAVLEGMK